MIPKIFIQVRGGVVQAVCANMDVKIALIDYDELESGKPAFNGDVLSPDAIFDDGEAHELFTDASDPEEMEIKDELKRVKF